MARSSACSLRWPVLAACVPPHCLTLVQYCILSAHAAHIRSSSSNFSSAPDGARTLVRPRSLGDDLGKDDMSGRLQAQLSAQILAHVRERRLSRGQHLPEQALADLFRVSRAPVHAALKALEESGVVRL